LTAIATKVLKKKRGKYMRTLIFNANIITGDGETILENRSLLIENGLISEILKTPYRYYDRSDKTIDAKGGFVIPGVINHHTHGITRGPLFDGAAQKPLPRSRVLENLNLNLLQGCTTVLNVDGLASMEEIEDSKRLTVINIKTCTIHTPLHLEAAKILNLGGLTDEHMLNVEDMMKKGAIAMGEAGSAIDTFWYDHLVIPKIVMAKTGVRILSDDAAALRKGLTDAPPSDRSAEALLAKIGARSASERLKKTVNQSSEYVNLAIEACREGAQMARRLGVPYLMHNAPETSFLIREFSGSLKNLLIASHSNFSFKPSEAIAIAREVKKHGGWVDIHTGDFFRARKYFPNHATTLSLLAEGLVDVISTDIIGFFWDPILKILQYAIEQNVINLPQAISLTTGNVLNCLPNIAPNRGLIEEGRVADLTIVNQKKISAVQTVIIGGKVVVMNGNIVETPD